MSMNALETALLNHYQRDFPLCSTPFTDIATQQNTDTQTILQTLKKLQQTGAISRVGPVFRPNTIGVSTLAAMQVPAYQLESVANFVSQLTEINHNYEREHQFNLWFVAVAPDAIHLENVLRHIEQHTGISVMRLPLVKEFHIDLGFKMPLNGESHSISKHHSNQAVVQHSIQPNDAIQPHLIAEIQSGLPLVEKPYAHIADKLGISESDVIRRLDILLTTGTIRRFGVVVRHSELGYRANAMVVWDIPDEQVETLGKQLSQINCITLCYQRPRHQPHWRYNLFTMIHGKTRESVEAHINDIVQQHDLQQMPKAILFSKRRFKQRGAHYSYAQPQRCARVRYG